MEELVRAIGLGLPEDCELTVVCGTNHSLYRHLTQAHEGQNRIHVQGYVENMGELMDGADLYLTKPGGLSTTEAAVARVPLALLPPIPGCESRNLKFFTETGMAISAPLSPAALTQALALPGNPEALAHMRGCQQALISPNAARQICGLAEGMA